MVLWEFATGWWRWCFYIATWILWSSWQWYLWYGKGYGRVPQLCWWGRYRLINMHLPCPVKQVLSCLDLTRPLRSAGCSKHTVMPGMLLLWTTILMSLFLTQTISEEQIFHNTEQPFAVFLNCGLLKCSATTQTACDTAALLLIWGGLVCPIVLSEPELLQHRIDWTSILSDR